MSYNKKGTALILSTIVLIVFSALTYFWQGAMAQNISQSEKDAIGVRIIPNPNQYSVYRWYKSQGFAGSPQALSVDGYEALRDGRTVYISAAQVVPETKTIYTNIYLISYNQDPNVKTIDILGQIISRWKFNDNLPQETAYCSISAVKCEKDSDCLSSQLCSKASGTCALKEPKVCAVDDNCPANFFCDSVKAKVIRDLKRVGRVEELREALAKYREINGRYPLLEAGTYLPGVSTSLWPSWNEVFLSTLKVNQSFVDPINRLGVCSGFDPKTCWNKDTQKFFSNLNNLTLQLPSGSYALVYTTNNSGSQYNLCSVLESRDASNPNLGYSLFPNNPASSICAVSGISFSGNANNNPPQIVNASLKGVSGLEFNGFVRALDPEGDPITWQIEEVTTSWPGWIGAPPTIKSTSDPNQKKIFADKAGKEGKYLVKLTVTDSKGLSTATTTEIEISPAINASQVNDYTYRLSPVIPFDFSFYIFGDVNNSNPLYQLSLISGPNILTLPGIVKKEIKENNGLLRVNYQGIIATSTKITKDLEAVYRLSIIGSPVLAPVAPVDQVDTPSTVKNFTVKIIAEKPNLNFNCLSEARLGKHYECFLGSNKQGSYNVTFSSLNDLPPLLQISETMVADDNNNKKNIYLRGVNTSFSDGNPRNITIIATNDYGATSSRSFDLKVNTYCGDGVKQFSTPNTEGKGGVLNDGRESCDGLSGVTKIVEESSKNLQYGCNTAHLENTPYPIATNNYCIYKSPLDGGGFCGDTFCQLKINGQDYENKENCPFDCDPGYSGAPPNLDGNQTNINCSHGTPCEANYYCQNGVCVPGCIPTVNCNNKTELEAINLGHNCGLVYDDCGRLIECFSNCANNEVCSPVGDLELISCPDSACYVSPYSGYCRNDNGCVPVVDLPALRAYGRIACIYNGPFENSTSACSSQMTAGPNPAIFIRSGQCYVGESPGDVIWPCYNHFFNVPLYSYYSITDGISYHKNYFVTTLNSIGQCSVNTSGGGGDCYHNCISEGGQTDAYCQGQCSYQYIQ